MRPQRFIDSIAMKKYKARSQSGGFGFLSTNPALESIRSAMSASDVVPGGLQAFLLTSLARTRSNRSDILDNLLHPTQVPVDNARAYGPGTYFAQTKVQSDKIFSHFGPNVYRASASPTDWIKLLFSKGYITPNELREKAIKMGYPDFELGGQDWNHPFIQALIKEGYVGFKHGDALTNWLVGAGDWKLKPTLLKPVNP